MSRSIGPSSGSQDRNLTAAGVSSSAGMRMSAHFWFSTDTPRCTFGSGQPCFGRGHGRFVTLGSDSTGRCSSSRSTSSSKSGLDSSDRIRACRFVRIWNVCCGASDITAKTLAMKSSGTSAWNRSDIEFTKTRAGLRQCSGSVSRLARRLTLPDQSTPSSLRSVVPANAAAIFGFGLCSRIRAVCIA
jgi:hypothetical protein